MAFLRNTLQIYPSENQHPQRDAPTHEWTRSDTNLLSEQKRRQVCRGESVLWRTAALANAPFAQNRQSTIRNLFAVALPKVDLQSQVPSPSNPSSWNASGADGEFFLIPAQLQYRQLHPQTEQTSLLRVII